MKRATFLLLIIVTPSLCGMFCCRSKRHPKKHVMNHDKFTQGSLRLLGLSFSDFQYQSLTTNQKELLFDLSLTLKAATQFHEKLRTINDQADLPEPFQTPLNQFLTVFDRAAQG